MWGGGLAGAEGQVQGSRNPQGCCPGLWGTHGHTLAGGRAPPRPQGLGKAERARLPGAGAPRWTAPRWGAGHRSGADGVGQNHRRPSTRSTGSKETTQADLGVHRRRGREGTERGPLPLPLLHPGGSPSPAPVVPTSGGSGGGPFLTLLTGPGRAVSDEPRHTGAGGRAAEGWGAVTSRVVPPGSSC